MTVGMATLTTVASALGRMPAFCGRGLARRARSAGESVVAGWFKDGVGQGELCQGTSFSLLVLADPQ
jgi:hypothetical protein